jgi:LuxR family transcriptional regulator, quorum-sensing system regulator CinR
MTENLPDKNVLSQALAIVRDVPDTELAINRLRDFLGVDHVVYVLLKPGAAPYVRLTYPAAWILRYLQRGYTTIDPISREGSKRSLPFKWSEVPLKDSAEASFFEDACSHGIGPRGYSVPLNEHGYKGIFSISFSRSEQEWADFLRSTQRILIQIAEQLHRRVVGEIFGEVTAPRRLE